MKLLRDVQAELQQFLSGRTVDVIIPPIIYVLMNNFFTLKIAVFFAILTASIFTIKRLIRKESILYAIGGVASVLLRLVLLYCRIMQQIIFYLK